MAVKHKMIESQTLAHLFKFGEAARERPESRVIRDIGISDAQLIVSSRSRFRLVAETIPLLPGSRA